MITIIKKTILLALVTTLGMTSCMYIGFGGKRPLYLVGAEDDIQVKNNGKKVDIKAITMANLVTSRNGNVKERIKYRHPAALIKCRRTNNLELTMSGKTAKAKVVGKAGKGILFLVLEAPVTAGIGTIVDLATVSFFYPNSKYFDVKAAFDKTAPKSKNELYKMALENSEKVYVTETQR